MVSSKLMVVKIYVYLGDFTCLKINSYVMYSKTLK